MNNDEIKDIAVKLLGDDFYKKLNLLRSDVEFFRMYMLREKKSEFLFDVRVRPNGAGNIFSDIWEKFAYDFYCLEEAFAIFVVLKTFIVDIKENGDRLSFETKKSFVCYFKEVLELDIADYIEELVDFNYEIAEVKEAFHKQFA